MNVNLINASLITPSTRTSPETGPNFVGLLEDYNQAVASIANLNKNLEKLEKNPTGPGAKNEAEDIETDLKTVLSLCDPSNLSGFYAYAGDDSAVKSAIDSLVLVTGASFLSIKKDLASDNFNAISEQVSKIEYALVALRESILG